MDLKWHEQAISEADTAAAFYKEKQPGLEIRFFDSLEDALNRIQHHPLIYGKSKVKCASAGYHTFHTV